MEHEANQPEAVVPTTETPAQETALTPGRKPDMVSVWKSRYKHPLKLMPKMLRWNEKQLRLCITSPNADTSERIAAILMLEAQQQDLPFTDRLSFVKWLSDRFEGKAQQNVAHTGDNNIQINTIHAGVDLTKLPTDQLEGLLRAYQEASSGIKTVEAIVREPGGPEHPAPGGVGGESPGPTQPETLPPPGVAND